MSAGSLLLTPGESHSYRAESEGVVDWCTIGINSTPIPKGEAHKMSSKWKY